MKTYYLSKKAANIRNRAKVLEVKIAQITDACKKIGIQVTPEIINELHFSATNRLLLAINEKQDQNNDAYALANLTKKSTKAIDESNDLLDNLRDTARRFTMEKALPATVWNGVKIDQKAIEAYIKVQCTVELTKEQESDIELILHVAKVLPRFDPIRFLSANGDPDIESYIEF